MKKSLLIVALIATAGLMSFTTTHSNGTPQTFEMTSGYVDIKIKNDTGEDHRVITSSGGSTTVKNQSGVTTVTVKDGDDLFLYDNGKKGAKLMTVSADMDGETFKLSDLM